MVSGISLQQDIRIDVAANSGRAHDPSVPGTHLVLGQVGRVEARRGMTKPIRVHTLTEFLAANVA